MSRLLGKLSRLERALRPRQQSTGTTEVHYPGGGKVGPHSRFQDCDLRDQHGPDCVMWATPTDSGVRFMTIISGPRAE